MFFGPKPGDPPAGRFDATDGSFRTCYAGLTPDACFAEKFLLARPSARSGAGPDDGAGAPRTPPAAGVRRPAWPDWPRSRRRRRGRQRLYAAARPWAAALFAHPQRPDGLCWRSRFDDSLFCVALFDRCKGDLHVAQKVTLISQPALLLAMIDRWRLALID
ncbi:MAG: RES domain-containing protein [Rhodospirillales bacterium]